MACTGQLLCVYKQIIKFIHKIVFSTPCPRHRDIGAPIMRNTTRTLHIEVAILKNGKLKVVELYTQNKINKLYV